ncbi:hypothetical protein ACHAPE_007934 [Trichoderma viride]
MCGYLDLVILVQSVRSIVGHSFDQVQKKEGKPKKRRKLSWTPSLAPTLVVIDESHQQMGKKALLYMMERILAVALQEEGNITRVPFWLLASATPWKDGLSDTAIWLPFICQNSAEQKKGMIKELVQQHHVLEETFESDDRMDLDGLDTLRRSVEFLFGFMIIARRKGTPILPTKRKKEGRKQDNSLPTIDGAEEPYSDGQPDYDKWLAVHNLFMGCITARQKSLSRNGSDLESKNLYKILLSMTEEAWKSFSNRMQGHYKSCNLK